jgi:hypothetical protein
MGLPRPPGSPCPPLTSQVTIYAGVLTGGAGQTCSTSQVECDAWHCKLPLRLTTEVPGLSRPVYANRDRMEQ